MKKAKQHGGSRLHSGRKRVLSTVQTLHVGACCEKLWRKRAEGKGWARYENEDKTRNVRQERQRIELIPVKLRARSSRSLAEIGGEIDEIRDPDSRKHFRRFVSIPLKRPYGERTKVIDSAVRWCWCAYRVRITRRRALECWKRYRAFIRQS